MTTDATSALRALADELRRLADDIARAGIKGFGNRATMIADELDAALTADAADGVWASREITARVTHEGRFPPIVRIRRVLSLLTRHANESAAAGNDRKADDLDSVSSFIREVFADYLDPRPHALRAHAQREQQAEAIATNIAARTRTEGETE